MKNLSILLKNEVIRIKESINLNDLRDYSQNGDSEYSFTKEVYEEIGNTGIFKLFEVIELFSKDKIRRIGYFFVDSKSGLSGYIVNVLDVGKDKCNIKYSGHDISQGTTEYVEDFNYNIESLQYSILNGGIIIFNKFYSKYRSFLKKLLSIYNNDDYQKRELSLPTDTEKIYFDNENIHVEMRNLFHYDITSLHKNGKNVLVPICDDEIRIDILSDDFISIKKYDEEKVYVQLNDENVKYAKNKLLDYLYGGYCDFDTLMNMTVFEKNYKDLFVDILINYIKSNSSLFLNLRRLFYLSEKELYIENLHPNNILIYDDKKILFFNKRNNGMIEFKTGTPLIRKFDTDDIFNISYVGLYNNEEEFITYLSTFLNYPIDFISNTISSLFSTYFKTNIKQEEDIEPKGKTIFTIIKRINEIKEELENMKLIPYNNDEIFNISVDGGEVLELKIFSNKEIFKLKPVDNDRTFFELYLERCDFNKEYTKYAISKLTNNLNEHKYFIDLFKELKSIYEILKNIKL